MRKVVARAMAEYIAVMGISHSLWEVMRKDGELAMDMFKIRFNS